MSKKLVLLPSTMAAAGWRAVRARSDIEAVAFEASLAKTEFHALLARAYAVGLSMTPFGAEELQAAPNLRVVARHGVGYDAVDVAALTSARIPLMITGVANSPSVAEHALYLMLELAKRGRAFHNMVAQHRWSERMQALPVDLFEKTVLIVGFGRIGSRLSKMCLGLNMRVTVYDPYVEAPIIRAAGCHPATDLDAALAEADFVSINCPKTQETTGMIAQAQLARMKPTAYIANTARGGIIDERALHAALSEGRIAGAGLDVFEREPPEQENPLFALPNVLLAPHMAGVTREALARMGELMVSNILSVLDGRPEIGNVVNQQIYAHQ